MFEFREVNVSDYALLSKYKNEFIENNELIVQGAAGLLQDDVEIWILERELYKNKNTLPNKNFVPAHTFIAIVENKIVGIINIRHELNDFLLNFGGHIGYSVSPSERRKGYAKEMLRRSLEFAFTHLKLKKVLITCDSENVASIKTIISCGGILENQVKEENRITNRYWIINK